MNPLVSILIPVYNRADIVGQTIESALKQTYSPIEIIIVDNCSTDATWEVLNTFAQIDSRIKLFKNEVNVGPVLNWKRCMDEASGEYAKILFSDDLISENFIEDTLAVFDADTAFVLSSINIFNDTDTNISPQRYDEKSQYSTTAYLQDVLLGSLKEFSVSPGCALFRTTDLKAALLIDLPNTLNLDFKTYGAGNDLLLFLNTALKYKTIKVVKQAVSHFRYHNQSFTVARKLEVYYAFSRYYFIITKAPQYLAKFKTYMWIYMKKQGDLSPIYALLKGPHDWWYGAWFLFGKLRKQV